MRILRIRLRNLNSLRGEHVVDFQAPPLAGAGLFAITGPTGAGKSTLLDALTLALYGRAARYGAAPSPEDMMSRHCGECRAEVEFQVPSGVYRAEWLLRRARGAPSGQVQAARRAVYDAAGQCIAQNVRTAEEAIERLVGLDYARFLRSALLAQGEFAQFLKARPDERAELLESLTGTAVYSELGALAHAEAVRRENDFQARQAAVQAIQVLEEAPRQQLAEDVRAGEATLRQVRLDLERANELLHRGSNLAAALEQQRQAQANHQALAAARQAAARDLECWARHRLTLPFQGGLAQLEAAEQSAAQAQARLGNARGDHAQALRQARRGLRALGRLLQEQIEAVRRDASRCRPGIDAAAARKVAAEEWLNRHRLDQDLAGALPDLVSELANLRNARRDVSREWARLRDLAGRLGLDAPDAPPGGEEVLTTEQVRQGLARLSQRAGRSLADATAAQAQAEAELERRERDRRQAQLVAGFEEHRGQLQPGEPCPLCGAREHPFAEGARPSFAFADLAQRVQDARTACQQRIGECNRLRQSSVDLQALEPSLVTAVGERTSWADLLAGRLAPLGLEAPAPGAEDAARSGLQQRARSYAEHAVQAQDAERERTRLAVELDRAVNALADLETRQSALVVEANLGSAGPEEAEREDEGKMPRGLTLPRAEKDWRDARETLARRAASLEDRESDARRAREDAAARAAALAARLTGSAFGGIDDLKAARLDPGAASRAEALERDLQERDQRLGAELRAASASVENWRARAAPEGPALAAVQGRQAELQGQRDRLLEAVAMGRNRLALDDQNRRALAEGRRELERERGQLRVWQQLRGLIGSYDGRAFRRYAQSISLDVLVHYANRQLARLSERYRLRRREDQALDLAIEDLHQAGAVRPMPSLSGGESFLASLALALGLSDIAGRHVRIESLFIDEGFGTLDSDTLDVAISALETLHQEHKTVGVISHVALLKERIAAQVRVEKQPGGTSVLRLSS